MLRAYASGNHLIVTGISALVLKADLYQLEGLTDMAREEKLLEALNYSDDPLLVLAWLSWMASWETIRKPFRATLS